MTQLFRHKWVSTEGEMLINGNYSSAFKLWARKTEGLSDEEWRFAFAELERKMVADAGNGRESWPPSYAEFIGMAKKTISPTGMNSDAYLSFDDPRHSKNRLGSVNYQAPAIADMGNKSRRDKLKAETLTNLKGLFK